MTAFFPCNLSGYNTNTVDTPVRHTGNPASGLKLKRGFDITFSAVCILVSLPVMAAVGICIRLSSKGPVIFRQVRTGLNGRPFTLYKFRTMYVNDSADTVAASPGDTRITPLGSFLRRSSIDELPQFFNVLKGDMSVVGPRPHMEIQTRRFSSLIDVYMSRHDVRPGITGWAQVNGHRGWADSEPLMRRRLDYDLEYIRNRSFALDLNIIIRTISGIFRTSRPVEP